MTFDRDAMPYDKHVRRDAVLPKQRSATVPASRASFTLVELLVSMVILLILATLTLRVVYLTLDSDRLSSGSRELQAFLAGARDRATYAGQPRGVRFIPDQTDPTTVTSFVYVGAPSNYSQGTITVVDQGPGLPSTISVPRPEWGPQSLTGSVGFRDRGLLPDGSRIQIPAGSGQWYTLAFNSSATPAFWGLTTRYTGVAASQVTYLLELSGAVLPGDAPRALPAGVVVDLDNSVLPAAWVPPYANPPMTAPPFYAAPLDVLFSPQGNVIGPPASEGRLHFVLSAVADVTGDAPIANLPARNRLNAPWQPGQIYAVGNVIVPLPSSYIAYRCTTGGTSATSQPPLFSNPALNQVVNDNGVIWQSFAKKTNTIISVSTASGRVTTHPVDVSDTLTPGPGYDTFRFAETGEVTQ